MRLPCPLEGIPKLDGKSRGVSGPKKSGSNLMCQDVGFLVEGG